MTSRPAFLLKSASLFRLVKFNCSINIEIFIYIFYFKIIRQITRLCELNCNRILLCLRILQHHYIKDVKNIILDLTSYLLQIFLSAISIRNRAIRNLKILNTTWYLMSEIGSLMKEWPISTFSLEKSQFQNRRKTYK